MTTIQPVNSPSCWTSVVHRLKREWKVIWDRKDFLIQLITWIFFRIIGYVSSVIIGLQIAFAQIATIIQQIEHSARLPGLPR